jgi:hypothetical protein
MKLAAIAIVLSITAAQAADTAILDRHVANMKSGNVDGIVADYAPDAVVVHPAGLVSPSGVFVGKDAKKLFSVLAAPANLPANKTMQVKYADVGPGVTKMDWVQSKGTKDELSGYDIFVVRGGKIAFQSVTIYPAKK